jgi:hypothetical protein
MSDAESEELFEKCTCLQIYGVVKKWEDVGYFGWKI